MSQKSQTRKKFELYQNDLIFTKILDLYEMAKCLNTVKLYTLKALLSKNRFYFFFLIFCHAKILPSFRMLCYWH